MVQAYSVPTAILRTITGTILEVSRKRACPNRLYLIEGLAPYIRPIETVTSFLEFWRETTGRADPGNLVEAQNRRWYQTITGRIAPGWYVVAVCYATVAILLGLYPWNFLLILLLFSSSKYLHYDPLDQAHARDLVDSIGSQR
jgi:hypothetical protein